MAVDSTVPRRLRKSLRIHQTSAICEGCKATPENPGARYCNTCALERKRARWRHRHRKLSPEARKRANARSYLHSYIRRGLIVKLPCQECGGLDVEAHHPDYSKPLEVIWLCRGKHLALSGQVERVKVLYRIKAVQPQHGDCESAV